MRFGRDVIGVSSAMFEPGRFCGLLSDFWLASSRIV
jgi:hypothetical protein